MLIIGGHLQLEPTERDGFLERSVEVIEAARAAPGCLAFSLSADLVDPGRVAVYERWDSDEELMRFRGSGPDDDQKAQILDAEVSKYRVSEAEAP